MKCSLLVALPAGALGRRGAFYLTRDPEAKRSGGIALIRVVLRPDRAVVVSLQAFGDLSAATLADMTLRLTVGGETYAASGRWRRRGSGWTAP